MASGVDKRVCQPRERSCLPARVWGHVPAGVLRCLPVVALGDVQAGVLEYLPAGVLGCISQSAGVDQPECWGGPAGEFELFYYLL